jgi:hypothetical protein
MRLVDLVLLVLIACALIFLFWQLSELARYHYCQARMIPHGARGRPRLRCGKRPGHTGPRAAFWLSPFSFRMARRCCAGNQE